MPFDRLATCSKEVLTPRDRRSVRSGRWSRTRSSNSYVSKTFADASGCSGVVVVAMIDVVDWNVVRCREVFVKRIGRGGL